MLALSQQGRAKVLILSNTFPAIYWFSFILPYWSSFAPPLTPVESMAGTRLKQVNITDPVGEENKTEVFPQADHTTSDANRPPACDNSHSCRIALNPTYTFSFKQALIEDILA
jgi:hypothetical protein